jgi:hypothetical protein
MAANNQALFPLTPKIAVGQLLSTAATAAKFYDGTDAVGTNMVSIFTAGVNGSRVDFIRVKYSGLAGLAPSGTSNSTVMHIFINNGTANTTATNNIFLTDFLVPAITYSNTVLNGEFTIPIGVSIPAGYIVYVNSQAATGGTNAAWAITAVGGDY